MEEEEVFSISYQGVRLGSTSVPVSLKVKKLNRSIIREFGPNTNIKFPVETCHKYVLIHVTNERNIDGNTILVSIIMDGDCNHDAAWVFANLGAFS